MSVLKAAFVTLSIVMGSSPAVGQGGGLVPPLPECTWNPDRGCWTSVQLRAVSTGSWRGYTELATTGGILVPELTFRQGILMFEAQGHIPRNGDAGGTLALFLHPEYAPASDAIRFAAGVREYIGNGPFAGVDREITVGAALRNALPVPETDLSLRADVSQLFGEEIDGTYGRVGVWLPLPSKRIGPGTLTVHPEAGSAVSSLPEIGDPSPGLHYHATDIRVGLLYDLAQSGEALDRRLPLRIGVDAGWLWPGDAVGDAKGWIAARLVLDLVP
jgi:hypothetical protein